MTTANASFSVADLACRANREVHRLRQVLAERDAESNQAQAEVVGLRAEVGRLRLDADCLARTVSHLTERYRHDLDWRSWAEQELDHLEVAVRQAGRLRQGDGANPAVPGGPAAPGSPPPLPEDAQDGF